LGRHSDLRHPVNATDQQPADLGADALLGEESDRGRADPPVFVHGHQGGYPKVAGRLDQPGQILGPPTAPPRAVPRVDSADLGVDPKELSGRSRRNKIGGDLDRFQQPWGAGRNHHDPVRKMHQVHRRPLAGRPPNPK
jgi:hypothetical protein